MANPAFFRFCGGLGLAGVLFSIAADVLSWFLADEYSPISQSISDLAVGPSSWLIDSGLWAFALACIAIGTGMLGLGLSAGSWRLAAVAAMAIGVEAAVISFVNEYAGTENAGANVHSWTIYLLYVSFAAAALGATPGLRELGSSAAGRSEN